MAKMMTVPAQILALVATLGVMPAREDDGCFDFRVNDHLIHASVRFDEWSGKDRFYIGASEGQWPDGRYISGQLPMDADTSSLSMERAFDTLKALMQRHPWDDRKGDFA